MKLILVAGTNENLTTIACSLREGEDLIKNLNDYVSFEDNLFELISKLNIFDKILIVSNTFCGMMNSSLVKFIELLKGQNLGLNINIDVVLLANKNEKMYFINEYFANVSKSLNVSVKLCYTICLEENLLGTNENLIEQINCLKNKLSGKTAQKLPPNGEVVIYTDGACSGNPGAGGWGAVLLHGKNRKEISGFDPCTTNNKMELTAVIMALTQLKKPCKIELYSDSAYVVNAIKEGWLENWKRNNWLGADKKQVKNVELWEELDRLLQIHEVNFNKVKGHANDELNNRCDELATGEIAKNVNE